MIQCIGYRVVDCELKLEDMWAAHRFRWWLVATHPCLGTVPLVPPVSQSNLTVRDVMPFVKRWPQEDEEQLILSPAEQARFAIAGHALRHYAVKLNQKLPTALHSWGGQTRACACLCREQGFSDDNLASRGIYAQLLALPPDADGTVKFRHLHAIEVALLNGVPIDMNWSPDQRLNLCAVGQMAAPMQSLWVAAHIWQHIDMTFGNGHTPSPVEHLMRFKHALWTQVKSVYPDIAPQPAAPPSVHQVTLHFADGTCVVVGVNLGDTVAQLMQAECAIQQVPADDLIIHDHEQTCVDAQALVAMLPELRVSFKSQNAIMSISHASSELPSLWDDLPDHPAPVAATSGETSSPVIPDTPGGSMPTPPPTPPQPVTAFESLLNLSVNQLVTLVGPIVCDSHMCAAMRSQNVPVHQRLQLLNKQQHAWGDDEVLWHFARLQAGCQDEGVVFVDPLMMTGWAQTGNPLHMKAFMSQFTSVKRVISAVLWRGHWTPYQWEIHHHTLRVTSWDHTDADINPMNMLHGFMCQALQMGSFEITCERRQFGHDLCGAATIAFAELKVLLRALPTCVNQLIQRNADHKQCFRDHLAVLGQCVKPWCWGEGVNDIQNPLVALLQAHGVPPATAPQRARLVVQALGKDDVLKALQSPEPWKTLKHMANQHKPLVQLVMPDEQQQVVANRNGKGRAKSTPGGKGKGKTKSIQLPTELDPTKLQLLENTFCTKDKSPVAQIGANQVGPLATGVAIMSVQEAKPFMQSSQLLTDKALALLVLNPPDAMPSTMLCTRIRFAAQCTVNQEPMLLTAALVQLGGTIIEPVQVQPASATTMEVACARFVAFRDQWPTDWQQFSQKPVKALLDAVSPLQVCREENCECGKYHVDPMQESFDLVLDVFRRQFFQDNGKPTKPESSTHFAVIVRYHKTQELAVLKLSGQYGLFVEPRVESGLEPSKEFQVVWIPQATYAEAQHNLQCEPHAIGLARTQHRYGIRVQAKHFQQVFQSLKPDGLFLAPGERVQWHTGPWPYGFDRKTLAKQFKEWGWQARRAANKAIGMQKPGVNPLVLLGMVEDACDPYYVGILQTVLVSRQMRSPDFWPSEVYPYAVGMMQSPPNSPVAILVSRLQSLGFSVHPDGQLSDSIGKFHPATLNVSELHLRFRQAWISYVAAQVHHRKDFDGTQFVDTHTTQKALQKLPVDVQAMMRLSLAGGQFTQDAHSHWDTDNTQCKWCGATDSLRHRYFECPETQNLRESHAPQVLQHAEQLPDVFLLRGWAIMPPSRLAWLTMLANIPTDIPPLHSKLRGGDNHVFTDGSCFLQHNASVRVAGWGVVLAKPFSPTWHQGFECILGSGQLPGLIQTAYRAELYSVAFVVHHAAVAQVNLSVYSDCLGVVNRCLLMLAGCRWVKVNSPNADLWQWLQDSLDRLGRSRVKIYKIKAHCELRQAGNLEDAWRIFNNAAVDGVARHAASTRTPEFWSLWRKLAQEVHMMQSLHAEIFELHAAVAKCSVLQRDPAEPLQAPAGKEKRVFPMTFCTADWNGVAPAALCQEYGEAMVTRMLRWWRRRTTGDNVGEVRWIPFAHLYVDFQLSVGSVGPIKFKKQWLDPANRPYMEPERHSFLQRLKWFRRFLKVFWKQTQIKVGLATTRGAGEAIQSFVACASVQWEQWAHNKADHWLLHQIRSPCLKGTTVLAHLPVAQLASDMVIQPEVPIPG
eukprot:Skav213059  [mRNA]  locus=scaffold364:426267:435025:- [translate_table: standard]